MAYTTKFITGTSSTMNANFDAIAAFFITADWVLHDTVGTRHLVYKTRGESNAWPYGYIELNLSGTKIYVNAWLYWDAVAHTGSCTCYTTSYSWLEFSNMTGWFICYGNANFIVIITDYYVTSNNATSFKFMGFIPKVFDTTVTTTVSGISTGSNVDVIVNNSSGFISGRGYQIVGINSEGRDMLTLQSVNGSILNFATIPRNYSAGAYVGTIPTTFSISDDSIVSNMNALCTASTVGTTSYTSGSNYLIGPNGFIVNTVVDPDGRTGKYALTPICMVDLATNASLFGYFDDYLFSAYGIGSLGDIHGIITTMQNYIFGTTTSGTSTTITDTSQSWTTNALTNKIVVIANGTGVGQTRVIGSNTSNTITVSGSAFYTTPVGGSSMYYVVDEAYRKISNVYAIRETIV